MSQSQDEFELIRRAIEGDRIAFEELVRLSSRLVYAKLYLETGNSHWAEDLVQETFLLAFRSIHRLKDETGFRPWLLTVAHNVLVDSVRRNHRQKRSAPPRTETPLGLIPDGGLSPVDQAAREELRNLVLSALRSLPEDYRLPLTLRYIVGSDPKSIETQLGLSNGALRGLLYRGLKLLRDRLPPDFVESRPERTTHTPSARLENV